MRAARRPGAAQWPCAQRTADARAATGPPDRVESLTASEDRHRSAHEPGRSVTASVAWPGASGWPWGPIRPPLASTCDRSAAAAALRPLADRVLPRRRGPLGAVQLGLRRAAGRHVRAAHRGHRRRAQPGRSGPRASSTRWPGSGSVADHRYEGPYFQSHYADAHRDAGRRLHDQGDAYYCDCTREAVDARNQGTGRQGYDGFCRDRGLEPAEGRALRFRTPRRGSHRRRRPDPRRADVRQRRHRGLRHRRAATARRCSCWPTSSTT